MIRILIIDDEPLTSRGIAATLQNEEDFVVCGQVGSGDAALNWLSQSRVDVIISEMMLTDLGGPYLIEKIKAASPGSAIVMVTRCEEVFCAERALRAGAKGYVLKGEVCNAIVKAVRLTIEGQFYVSDQIIQGLLTAVVRREESLINSPEELLSDQELQVFELTGRGLSSRETAERMGLSTKTVESYRNRMKVKLRVHSYSDLILEAARWSKTRGPCSGWHPCKCDTEKEKVNQAAETLVEDGSLVA